MFEVKWFLFKSEKEMNADKILPIDLVIGNFVSSKIGKVKSP